LRKLKNCIGWWFWGVWEGLYEFIKFNICCYNIFKIKNILIISINLSPYQNILFQKMWKLFQFSPIFLSPKVFLSPPLQTSKQSFRRVLGKEPQKQFSQTFDGGKEWSNEPKVIDLEAFSLKYGEKTKQDNTHASERTKINVSK